MGWGQSAPALEARFALLKVTYCPTLPPYQRPMRCPVLVKGMVCTTQGYLLPYSILLPHSYALSGTRIGYGVHYSEAYSLTMLLCAVGTGLQYRVCQSVLS